MNTNPKVRLTKLSAVENPLVPSGKVESYKAGQDNGAISLPIEYTVEGTLIGNIVVGQPLKIHRTKRNNVEAEGLTCTTPIVKTAEEGNKCTIHTANSVYLLEAI